AIAKIEQRTIGDASDQRLLKEFEDALDEHTDNHRGDDPQERGETIRGQKAYYAALENPVSVELLADIARFMFGLGDFPGGLAELLLPLRAHGTLLNFLEVGLQNQELLIDFRKLPIRVL